MANFKNSLVASAAAFATFVTVAASTPLHAETLKVAYGDLDVSSPAGAAELRGRIHRAAYRVCGQEDAGTRFAVAACRAQAVKSAQAQLALKTGRSDVRLAAR